MGNTDIIRKYLYNLIREQQEDIYSYGASWISFNDINVLLNSIPNKYLDVKKFLIQYFKKKRIYSVDEFYSIINLLKDENLLSKLELEDYYLVREILGYLGYPAATREDDSTFSHIENNFDLKNNIIQVGTGKIPYLAEKIRLSQGGKGKIEVWDPAVIMLDSMYPELIKHDKYLWDIPEYTNLIIANDVCPSDQLFVDLAINKDVGLYLRPCSNYHYVYFPDKDKWDKLPGDDFCQAMLDIYSNKDLKCEENGGKLTLIKRK